MTNRMGFRQEGRLRGLWPEFYERHGLKGPDRLLAAFDEGGDGRQSTTTPNVKD